jgi:hypothetical protein
VLALSLVGCGAWPWDRPPLLTRAETDDPNTGCVLMGFFGQLVPDPESGTAIVGALDRHPIRWPHGYTARRVGSELEVIDPIGKVVAVTGMQVELFYLFESKLYEGKPGSTLLACGLVRSID